MSGCGRLRVGAICVGHTECDLGYCAKDDNWARYSEDAWNVYLPRRRRRRRQMSYLYDCIHHEILWYVLPSRACRTLNDDSHISRRVA